jgi:dTDP-4-amino-4,6-dideoxygalactose transaminase
VALAAYGIGPGDEVITTTLTFAATANVVELLGARPVLVDVEPDTMNMDPALVERAVTSRTRMILPVHFAGQPADMDALEAIASAHRLAIVEDAAHALPARYRGRIIGSAAHPTAFSFYATKNLTTAEGGMLTGDPDFLARCRVLSLHGMSADAASRYRQGGRWAYEVVAPGFKYNMTDIAAAIGRVQLGRLDGFQARRQAVVRAYLDAFAGEEALELPLARPDVEHAWHLFPLRLRDGVLSIGRDRFIEELTALNIGTSVHFIPLHLHPYYRDRYRLAPGDFPVALDSFRRLASLPLYPRLSDGDVADVIAATYDVLRRFRR